MFAQVISYLCTIMLKLDDSVRGPYLTQNGVTAVMVGINAPMAIFFLYDIIADVREYSGQLNANILREQPSEA
eukprot:COSAG06_NODE_25557_length_634_cov_0.669159_1_plen_73_part_00